MNSKCCFCLRPGHRSYQCEREEKEHGIFSYVYDDEYEYECAVCGGADHSSIECNNLSVLSNLQQIKTTSTKKSIKKTEKNKKKTKKY